ncbi:MAG: type V CRISPR-associated protein Cas12a/Cpf1 [Oscillospiraceae bacterium]|nr:type V CRISPR-associated protein Cas12a/Cpf1 [Oscillospiraceae bacterium]
MRKIEQFTGKYKVSKTLRFSLIPQGKTEEYIHVREYIEEDEQRAKDYARLKELIDEYHIRLIDEVLSVVRLPELEKYRALYEKTSRSDTEEKSKQELEQTYRTLLSGEKGGAFSANENYRRLFGKEMLTELLPPQLEREEDKAIVAGFSSFYTYLYGFNDNRKNVYSKEAIPTAIGNRCVQENLPRFLDNLSAFEKVKTGLRREVIDQLRDLLREKEIDLDGLFRLEGFNGVLTQRGIDRYNTALGGYTGAERKSIRGMNELINEHNQSCAREDRLPKLKPLYKMILSERKSYSWIPEEFKTDEEVYAAVGKCFAGDGDGLGLLTVRDKLYRLFADLEQYDQAGIYLDQAGVRAYSSGACGAWSDIRDAWFARYDLKLSGKKRPKDYEDKREKAWNKETCFSLRETAELAEEVACAQEREISSPADFWKEKVVSAAAALQERYAEAEPLLKTAPEGLRTKNETVIGPLKALLDGVKTLEGQIRPFVGTEKGSRGDAEFYGELLPLWDILWEFDRLYDRVRNYVTQKPYSQEKFKLNFRNPQFLKSWPENKEKDYMAIILREAGVYYLGVMNEKARGAFADYPKPIDESDCFEKMHYQQMADPSKDVQNLMVDETGKTVCRKGRKEKTGEHQGENLQLEEYKNKYLPDNINRIRKSKSYSVSNEKFNPSDLAEFIDYYKERVCEYLQGTTFVFRESRDYASFKDFTDDIDRQAYQLSFEPISRKYIESLVNEGKLYLFQIYNKDFSAYSKGKPNLHTLYFRMLFDERNLADTVFKLSGGAELFYRKASLKEKITHPSGQPIPNKDTYRAAQKPESVFPYDLIKDKRYTRPQYSLHISIELNTQAPSKPFKLDEEVREALAADPETRIIGIDRGERNLLYICVIDGQGRILEQRSLNALGQKNGFPVDYQAKLVRWEKENEEARKNWSTIQGIKELKEGYLSQVIHELCLLIEKYDAVIALEDLNPGFKNSRKKVERQVYQKFENALIDKLSFLTDKGEEPDAPGGLLHAYQLAAKPQHVGERRLQNGFVLYVDPGFTSKIDPVTGFVDLLYPRYTSVAAALELIGKLEGIRYVPEEDLFAIEVDYGKFDGTASSPRKKWTLWSYGKRVHSYRDQKSGQWSWEEIDLTGEFRRFFDHYGIDISGDIRQQLLDRPEKEVLEGFLHLFRLMLQMRNSIPNGQEDDLVSPVRDESGRFFDTRTLPKNSGLPENADANGAYNIARKALLMLREMREDPKHRFKGVKREDWMRYVQSHE